jgi:peptidoglycan/xylan/chitin deacetylase (PgdA/CDA1 family)
MVKRKATILLYHQVGESPTEHTNLECFCSIEEFEKQMRFLYESEFEVISLNSLVSMIKDQKGFDKDYVVLTFDDGCERFQTVVMPILKKYNVPSTIYPVSGNLGNVASWPEITNYDLRILSKENLAVVANSGVEVGGHTINHVKLGKIPKLEAKNEIEGCKLELERILGQEIFSFSYPHGSYSEEIIQLVSSLGFKCAVTCQCSSIYGDEDLFKLPRKYVTYSDNLDSFKQLLRNE